LQVEGSDGVAGGAIMYTASGVASGYMSADAAGLCLATDTAGITFRTGVTGADPTDTGSERMRIDASGNLLVGKTGADSNAVGIELHSNDVIKVTRSGGAAGYFNRQTSDGSIIDFAKDGTTVGSIGALSSRLYIGTGVTGLFFNNTSGAITPYDVTGQSQTDADVDLGVGSVRFKDLYLSGTVNANSVDLGSFVVTETNGHLYFSVNGVNKMKLDASGNLDVVGSVNSNATIT
jgi:hypothetical protein